jgi:putative tryptophan/tyrosine transport system substrate-binding protein
MRRREFIAALGGAAAWQVAARAQQPAMPVIGFLNSGEPEVFASVLNAFWKGLNEAGYTEGRNVAVEYRWARNQFDKLPTLASELVTRHVDVVAATGGNLTPHAAKNATATIPIVFTLGYDPVAVGLVPSLSRPDGNMTGVTFFASNLVAKQIALLHELIPGAASLALLLGPDELASEESRSGAENAARAFGVDLRILNLKSESDLDQAFAMLAEQRTGGVIFGSDPFFARYGDRTAKLAEQYAIPAISIPTISNKANTGVLISYGTVIADCYHDAGLYVAKILKGAKPAELPILLPVKFRLVINLQTAKALGLTIPPRVLAIADEVIE